MSERWFAAAQYRQDPHGRRLAGQTAEAIKQAMAVRAASTLSEALTRGR